MSSKKKILITGGKGMLAYDFIRTQKERFSIIALDRDECDITSFESIMQSLSFHKPDIVLNCAAYTQVDDAEDIGMKVCFDVNTLGVKNLAKATSLCGIDFITISTDYVFDGNNPNGYLPKDICNPINIYGMSKYLGERLAIEEYPRTIIVRTSWLYGGNPYGSSEGVFRNFVNTMLRISESQSELKIVSDQYGIPTSCIDLSFAISELIDNLDRFIENGDTILHFSNSCSSLGITWADFAREIFSIVGRDTEVIDCSSGEYQTKARRPSYSILRNISQILLLEWKEGLARYLRK